MAGSLTAAYSAGSCERELASPAIREVSMTHLLASNTHTRTNDCVDPITLTNNRAANNGLGPDSCPLGNQDLMGNTHLIDRWSEGC